MDWLARLALGTAVGALVGAAPASAATFCVGKPACVAAGGTNATSLQNALDQANANGPDFDRIELGDGYEETAPATDVAGNDVDIVGAGDGSGGGPQTLLRGTGSPRLTILEPTSKVGFLHIRLTKNNETGLSTKGVLSTGLSVTDESGAPSLTGVQLLGDAKLEDAGIFLPTDSGSVLGVKSIGSSATSINEIDDVTVHAGTGIGALDGGLTTVAHAFVRAQLGVNVFATNTNTGLTVDDALVEVVSGGTAGLTARTSNAGDPKGTATLGARHATVVGPGSATGALTVDGNLTSPFISAANTIFSGFGTDFDQGSGGEIAANWSRFDTGGVPPGTGNTDAPPRFVNPDDSDPDHRDFGLLPGSQLIDAGDPAALGAGEPTTDLQGRPRVVNGNDTDCVARRDIGANEFQPGQRGPINVTAAASPGSVSTGQAATFSAGGCDPDGDPLTFSWSFDDGGTGSGTAFSYAFGAAGTRSGTVTARDPGGRSASASTSLSVTAPSSSGGSESGGGSSGGSSSGGSSGGSSSGGATTTGPPLSTPPDGTTAFRGLKTDKRGNLVFSYDIRSPGTLAVAVTGPPTKLATTAAGKKKGKRKAKPLVVGRATATAAAAGTVPVTVTPSSKAKSLLRSRKRLAVTATATFTPTGGSPTTTTAKATAVAPAATKRRTRR
jgi:hypothetical protein